ncbi:MAG: hypothetical protein EA378_06255 [Phycisphaerales bacterium]|nr:MAG: hypothetical protein EA378_06255 [Phycisphaerales bacterium]
MPVPPAARLTRPALLAFLLAGGVAAPSAAQTFDFDRPQHDRWHYPFNGTPGSRLTASTFLYVGPPGFNNRDGAFIIVWNTAALIPPGQDPEDYNLAELRVTLTNEAGAEWEIDLTTDEWFTQVPGVGGDDTDPGQPIELFGVGFGPTYTEPVPGTANPWNEFSPYIGSDSLADIPRDPYPFVYQDETGDRLRVEDHVAGLWNDQLEEPVTSFTPIAWAIGNPQNYTPGNQPVPFDVVFDVDLTLSDGLVRAYFQDQLSKGYLAVIVTSFQPSVMFGPSNSFGSFYTKEGADFAADPSVRAPRLAVTLADATPDCPADITGPALDGVPDGAVTIADLNFYLTLWLDNDPQADITGPALDGVPDGAVTIADLNFYIDLWINTQGACP